MEQSFVFARPVQRGSLPGPSRIITVEPIEVPVVPEPLVLPDPPDAEPSPEPAAPDVVPAS